MESPFEMARRRVIQAEHHMEQQEQVVAKLGHSSGTKAAEEASCMLAIAWQLLITARADLALERARLCISAV